MIDQLAIIHRDDGLVVVAKPAGPPSTGRTPETAGSIEFALARQLKRKVWAVHQLDRFTSGCNLFVLKKSLVQAYGDALRGGGKVYLAICHGRTDDSFEVNTPVGRRQAPLQNKTFPCLAGPEAEPGTVRNALTRFTTVAHSADGTLSLVLAHPATGRTHQIRLHLASVGHPLVGEEMHRDPPCRLAERHQLHALMIAVAPVDLHGEARFVAPLEPDMRRLVERYFDITEADIAALATRQVGRDT